MLQGWLRTGMASLTEPWCEGVRTGWWRQGQEALPSAGLAAQECVCRAAWLGQHHAFVTEEGLLEPQGTFQTLLIACSGSSCFDPQIQL